MLGFGWTEKRGGVGGREYRTVSRKLTQLIDVKSGKMRAKNSVERAVTVAAMRATFVCIVLRTLTDFTEMLIGVFGKTKFQMVVLRLMKTVHICSDRHRLQRNQRH